MLHPINGIQCNHEKMRIIHNSPKVETIQIPITNEGINKTWYDVHTMEYPSAINRNGVLVRATTGTNRGNVVRSEWSQTQKASHSMTPPT